jgi:hypothetical protein
MVVFQLLAKNPAQRPSMDEVVILLRSVAAVADVVPLDSHVKVPAAPRPPPPSRAEPAGQFVLPPQLVEREPIDPALERAFMGEIGPQPEETPPGVPAWAPRVWPAWARPAAAGAAVLLVALVVALWPSKKSERPPAPAPVTRRTRAQPPVKTATQEPPPRAAMPPEPPPAAVKADPPPEIGDSSPKIESSSDGAPAAKMLDRAQNAVWAGKPYAAESILRKVLKHKDLSRRDKARAEKLMGDAALKRGSRPGAAVWYHRALRSADDRAYKERIQKALAAVEPPP